MSIETLAPGDQRVFYADFGKSKRELDWESKINPEEGMELLFNWVVEDKSLFQKFGDIIRFLSENE